MKKTVLVCLVTLAMALPAMVAAQKVVNESRPAAPDGVVEVENVAGSVKVVGWGRDEVQVTGTLGRGTERLDFDSSNGRTLVKVVIPDRHRNVEGSDLEIMVPSASRVEVGTVSASITVDELSGRLELESVSGRIRVGGRPEALEAAAVSGDVDVEFAPSGSEMASVSGDVTVLDGVGDLEAASVSGDVALHAGRLDSAQVETVSGDVRVEMTDYGTGRFDLETVSGSATMVVPSGISADFELSTFSGKIRSDIGPRPERSSEYGPGEELSFSSGSGGPRISISSFSGTVRLVTK